MFLMISEPHYFAVWCISSIRIVCNAVHLVVYVDICLEDVYNWMISVGSYSHNFKPCFNV